jgi:O-antigen ligase
MFISRRRLYWLTTLSAIVVVIFTYNKTMYFIIALTLLIKTYRRLRERARLVALSTVTIGLCGVAYCVMLFLRGELPLTEIALFLSPQTFWSRVGIWESLASFTSANLYSGLGAGYMTKMDLTVDNQYLYTYLEMGLCGAVVYFALIAASFRDITRKAVDSGPMLILLALIFLIGDMLNALALMYVVGLFLGVESSGSGVVAGRDAITVTEPNIIPAIGGTV